VGGITVRALRSGTRRTADAETPSTAGSTATIGARGDPAARVGLAPRVRAVVPRPPRLIRLPIGRWIQLHPVATTSNGVLDVPGDVDVAGWWEGGSRLGDPSGSMLVAAHIDARRQGPGPFASLLTARPGERIRVRGGGLGQTYEVGTLRLRPQGTIAPTSWLHSPRGPARLTLVTSAGPSSPDLGGYQDLAVIVAFPIGEVRRR
jgi:hypothetical protein